MRWSRSARSVLAEFHLCCVTLLVSPLTSCALNRFRMGLQMLASGTASPNTQYSRILTLDNTVTRQILMDLASPRWSPHVRFYSQISCKLLRENASGLVDCLERQWALRGATGGAEEEGADQQMGEGEEEGAIAGVGGGGQSGEEGAIAGVGGGDVSQAVAPGMGADEQMVEGEEEEVEGVGPDTGGNACMEESGGGGAAREEGVGGAPPLLATLLLSHEKAVEGMGELEAVVQALVEATKTGHHDDMCSAMNSVLPLATHTALMMEKGGIEAVVEAMGAPGAGRVQWVGCFALKHFAMDLFKRGHAKAIAARGGVEAILGVRDW